MVPQDADADIDDVLKQSEALLDRLHANQSERDLDGGASLSSLTSLGSFMNGSVVKELTTPNNVMSPRRTVRVKIPTETLPKAQTFVSPLMMTRIDPFVETGMLQEVPDLEAAPTMPTVNTTSAEEEEGHQQLLLPPPSPSRPPNWEKVSSAAQGDADYVPMVDYSNLKPPSSSSSQAASTRIVSSKVSRLEAYRKKALHRRRRRRAIGFAVAMGLMLAYWIYSSSSSSSRAKTGFTTKKINGKEFEEMMEVVTVQKDIEIPVVQKEIQLEHDEPTDRIGEVTGGDVIKLESEGIDEVSEVLLVVEKEGDVVEVVAPSSWSHQYRGDALQVTDPPTGTGRDLDYCKHPLAKFLAKSCKNAAAGPRVNLYLLMEKPVKAFVENPIFMVV